MPKTLCPMKLRIKNKTVLTEFVIIENNCLVVFTLRAYLSNGHHEINEQGCLKLGYPPTWAKTSSDLIWLSLSMSSVGEGIQNS